MKRVLAIVPYQRLYPPTNGGMLRCFHLLNQLAAHTDLTAIIHQDLPLLGEAKENYPALENSKVYSTKDAVKKRDLFSLMPQKIQTALRYRWQNRTIKGPGDINFLLFYPVVTKLLREENYDIVYLESISSLNLVSLIRRLNKDVRIIYDAHNVDSNLAREEYEKKIISKKTYEMIYAAEANLSETIDGIVACSTEDLNAFQKLNNNNLRGAVIPNGVKITHQKDQGGGFGAGRSGLLFCGSLDYAPNIEGLLWFYKEVWPIILERLPGIELTIIGGGIRDPQLAALELADSVKFIGRVQDVTKFYEKARVSIVPLLSGSGTRLKILEAMSLGVPVVSTSKGAEGIEFCEGENILIADEKKKFADLVVRLMEDQILCSEMSRSAHELVREKYDWDIIGDNLSFYFNSFYAE